MSLEKYIQGSVRHYKGGSFYLVERDFSQVDSGTIGQFIRKNKDYLILKNIRRQFPELEHIPKHDMLFFDIETGGLDFSSPIISIATAHMHRGANLTFQCAFARNPAEERAVIRYFLDMLPNYEAFLSYNGKSFDAPRIQERAIHNGLFDRSRKKLKDLLNGHNGQEKHHDLYHISQKKSRIALPDGRLKTIEKILFHYRRKEDIESEDIPRVYYEYVYGRERAAKKVMTDPKLWKQCAEKAEASKEGYKKRRPDADPKDVDAHVRSYAQGLYNGMFADVELPHDWDGIGSIKGGYREVYYPGERIDEEERKADMARLINHNLLDVNTLMAILCYLCAPHPENIVLPAEDLELEGEAAVPF